MPDVKSLYLDLPTTVLQPREEFAGADREPFHLRIPISWVGTVAETETEEPPPSSNPLGLEPGPGMEDERPAGADPDAAEVEPEPAAVERPEDDPFAETEDPPKEPAEQPGDEPPRKLPEADPDRAPSIFDDYPELEGEETDRPAEDFEGKFENFGPGPPNGSRGAPRGRRGQPQGPPGKMPGGIPGVKGQGMRPGMQGQSVHGRAVQSRGMHDQGRERGGPRF